MGQCDLNLNLDLDMAISDNIVHTHLFQEKLSFLMQQEEVQILVPPT